MADAVMVNGEFWVWIIRYFQNGIFHGKLNEFCHRECRGIDKNFRSNDKKKL